MHRTTAATIAALAFAAFTAQPAAAACPDQPASVRITCERAVARADTALQERRNAEQRALSNEATRQWKAAMRAPWETNPDAGKPAFFASMRASGVADSDIEAAWAANVAYALDRYAE